MVKREGVSVCVLGGGDLLAQTGLGDLHALANVVVMGWGGD